MTEAQTDLYNFLKRQAAKGLCPSFDEMRAYLGLASKSGVHRLLTALEEQGRIRRDKNRARRIEILPERTPLSRVSTGELIAELTGRGYCAIPHRLLESVEAV